MLILKLKLCKFLLKDFSPASDRWLEDFNRVQQALKNECNLHIHFQIECWQSNFLIPLSSLVVKYSKDLKI